MAGMTAFSDIEPTTPDWVWQHYIPAGEVTIAAGEGGIGKSFWSADLAARISRGQAMPDGSPGGPPGSVVLISAEDDPSMTTVNRLNASGADLTRVHDLSEPDGMPFETPADLPKLRAAIAEIGDVRAVFVDPLAAVAACPLTSVTTVRRRVLQPLRALARDTGVAVVAVSHLTKAGQIAGSRAVVDGVRSVLLIARDPDDARLRVIRVHKSNLAPDGVAPVRYGLAGEHPSTRVIYATAPDDGTRPGSGQAAVLSLLRLSGPLPGQAVAQRTGIAYHTVKVLLGRLVKRGLVAKDGGTYRAVSASEPLTSTNA